MSVDMKIFLEAVIRNNGMCFGISEIDCSLCRLLRHDLPNRCVPENLYKFGCEKYAELYGEYALLNLLI